MDNSRQPTSVGFVTRSMAGVATAARTALALGNGLARFAPCLWVGLIGLAPAALGAVADLSPGDRFRDCPTCPEMVVVPAGVFVMGSSSSEQGHFGDEGPQHRVRIARPFAVGVYEVTFDQWDACERDFGCGNFGDDEGWGRGARPVVNVSWNDAQEYVVWLSEKTGRAYRLLSESEWEYAARAGTTTPFHFGRTISSAQANYDWEYTYGHGSTVKARIDSQGGKTYTITGVPEKGIGSDKTVPVGRFPANGFGLHDMHGNVWEWVQDCWNPDYDRAPRDGAAWENGDCARRVLRGGSWSVNPWYLRSAYRSRSSADSRYNSIGFRVARTLTP